MKHVLEDTSELDTTFRASLDHHVTDPVQTKESGAALTLRNRSLEGADDVCRQIPVMLQTADNGLYAGENLGTRNHIRRDLVDVLCHKGIRRA